MNILDPIQPLLVFLLLTLNTVCHLFSLEKNKNIRLDGRLHLKTFRRPTILNQGPFKPEVTFHDDLGGKVVTVAAAAVGETQFGAPANARSRSQHRLITTSCHAS